MAAAGTVQSRPVATVIGDVVRSKQAEDRAALHHALVRQLDRVNAVVPAEQGLDVTLGDEFQAAYRSVGDALLATMLLRLALLPDVDTRYGIGWGDIAVYDAHRRPVVQDGPGWWAAREAILHVKSHERRKGHARHLRTWFIDKTAEAATEPARTAPSFACLNAFLLCRDELVGRQNDRGRRLLLGWLTGTTQVELAEREGITQSAVSQKLGSNGSYAIRDAHQLLEEMTAWTSWLS